MDSAGIILSNADWSVIHCAGFDGLNFMTVIIVWEIKTPGLIPGVLIWDYDLSIAENPHNPHLPGSEQVCIREESVSLCGIQTLSSQPAFPSSPDQKM